jgi:hypothetical protein
MLFHEGAARVQMKNSSCAVGADLADARSSLIVRRSLTVIPAKAGIQ